MNLALIPAFNEENSIHKVILGCLEYVEKVIVADDGSTDMTGEIAEAMGCEVIMHHTNLGKGAAMRSLFREAAKLNPHIVITIDADGQHDPKEIPKLFEKIEEGFDVVIGSRKGMEGYRAFGNRILSSSEMDTQSGFRAYRGSILTSLVPSEMGMAVDSEILQRAREQGLKIAEVAVSVDYSVPNPHKTNTALHFLDVLFGQFKLATFRHPLILYGIPGLTFILISLFFGVRAYNISFLGIGEFPVVIVLGLVSIYLMLIGLAALSTAIVIWTVSTLTRRLET